MSVHASSATVETEAGARYRRQLASHLGRKNAVEERDEAIIRLTFTYGRCDMSVESGTGRLLLEAEAGTEDDLEHVQRVIASHLTRFSVARPLEVRWGRPTVGST